MKAEKYSILLKCITPISHHDPANTDSSNRLMFNRAKVLIQPDKRTKTLETFDLKKEIEVPMSYASLFNDMSIYELIGASILRLFIAEYSSMDGVGLFTGMERYERLEGRVRQAAIKSEHLRVYWENLCNMMQMPIHKRDTDQRLWELIDIPKEHHPKVIEVIANQRRMLISLARIWHKAKGEVAVSSKPTGTVAHSGESSIEIPAIQGNSVRHVCVRESAWQHLCKMLDINSSFPGDGDLPAGVESLFLNGGNIKGGSKQPANSYQLAWQIRRTFPTMDLLGGCVNSFDLGESRLKLSVFIVCSENADSIPEYDSQNKNISAIDMLDDVTLTRQADRQGEGQMIYNFEALSANSEIITRFTLDSYTPELTKGAFKCAIDTYFDNARIGGQGRAGFGELDGKWLNVGDLEECKIKYENYLIENKDQLKQYIIDGTLGTGQVVCT